MQPAAFINGKLAKGAGPTLSVEDPSYGKVFASFPGASLDQTKAAIAAARRAFDDGKWSGLSINERATIVRCFIKALASRADQLTEIIVKEAGCPKSAGVMNAQVRGPLGQASDIVDLFLSLPDLEENPLPLSERANAQGQFVQSLRRYTPIGVVAAQPRRRLPRLPADDERLRAVVSPRGVNAAASVSRGD